MINRLLQKRLLKMAGADQKMRKSSHWDSAVDRRHTLVLKKIIQKYGWPDNSLVGKKGATAAWLLAQHADHDIRFQRKCLRLVEAKVEAELISQTHLAYLTDRVLVHDGKFQVYGTQFHRLRNGELGARPIKDRPNLEQRRRLMQLEPFTQYENYMKIKYRYAKKPKG